MKILVSNLSHLTTANHLFSLFVKFGVVHSIDIIRDNFNGYSSGVGYVKMDKFTGAAAVYELNSINFMNNYIEVAEMPM